MANYNIPPEDMQNCISRLNFEIEYMEEELASERSRQDGLYHSSSMSATERAEYSALSSSIAELSQGIEVLTEMKDAIVKTQEDIDNKVGFKTNGETFVFQEEEADGAMDEMKFRFDDDNLQVINKFTSDYEHFCGMMKRQETKDKVAIDSKKKNDNKAFDHNSREMEDMLIQIQKLNTRIGEKFDEAYLKYETVFGDLRGEELIDEICAEFDFEIDLKEIKLGNVSETDLKNIAENVYSIGNTTFDGYLDTLSEEQIKIFEEYFNVDRVDDIVEVSVKYEAFEDLLKNNPNALDEIWEFFDEVGVEGIYSADEIGKLPPGWETSGKYIQIGGYVINIAVFTNGFKNQDWSQVGGVLGAFTATEMVAKILIDIFFVDIKIPAKVVITIISGIIGQIIGEEVGEQFE